MKCWMASQLRTVRRQGHKGITKVSRFVCARGRSHVDKGMLLKLNTNRLPQSMIRIGCGTAVLLLQEMSTHCRTTSALGEVIHTMHHICTDSLARARAEAHTHTHTHTHTYTRTRASKRTHASKLARRKARAGGAAFEPKAVLVGPSPICGQPSSMMTCSQNLTEQSAF